MNSAGSHPALPEGPPMGRLGLSVVVPCHNEGENVQELHARLEEQCRDLEWELIFIDDGSSDNTAETVKKIARKDPRVRLIALLRNAGHQIALRAGMRASRGEYVVTMDADLQHPPSLIPALIEKARQGYDVVHTVRAHSRQGILKGLFSRAFYWFFNRVSEVPILPNSSDFRLLSRRVVDVLNSLPERKLVFRAVLPVLGFRASSLEYREAGRYAGRRAYSFASSWNLGVLSFFNFTALPLDIGFKLGVGISLLAFCYAGWAIFVRLTTDNYTPGFTDIIASVLLLGGITLIYLGILGKYLSVVLDYLKGRPEYLEWRRDDQ